MLAAWAVQLFATRRALMARGAGPGGARRSRSKSRRTRSTTTRRWMRATRWRIRCGVLARDGGLRCDGVGACDALDRGWIRADRSSAVVACRRAAIARDARLAPTLRRAPGLRGLRARRRPRAPPCADVAAGASVPRAADRVRPAAAARPRLSASHTMPSCAMRAGWRKPSQRASSSCTVAVAQFEQAMHVEVLAAGDLRPGRGAAAGTFRRSHSARSGARPACSWPMCFGSTSAGVSALPRSCASAAKPTTASPGASRAAMSQTSSMCTPVSTSGWYSARCGTPYSASTSGSTTASAPQSRSVRRKADGVVDASARASSCHTRSGHEVGHLAGGDHVAHQRHRFRRDGEAERREARHEARRAQHAQRILGEGRADVAQHARFEVARAAERIDERAVVVLRDRVDGEVAPLQVFARASPTGSASTTKPR